MSSRALRRLQREREEPLEKTSEGCYYEEEDFKAPKGAAFDLLALSSDSSATEEDLEDLQSLQISTKSHPSMHNLEHLGGDADGEGSDDITDQGKGRLKDSGKSQGSKDSKSKGKGKDKDKRREKQPVMHRKEELPGKDQDLEDEMLEQLLLKKAQENVVPNVRHMSRAADLFTVDLENLDPSIELKRKIGLVDSSHVDEPAESESSEVYNSLPPRVKAQLKLRQRPAKRRRNQLIAAKPGWERITSAVVELRLKRVAKHQLYGNSAFALVPSATYERQFSEFVNLVEAGDIQLLYNFSQANPLHIDALLVVSEFLQMSSNADSLEFTERALYILEKCTLATGESGVSLTNGTMRMPYDCFENRRMHLALLRYVQSLAKRGCYRTALEFCKILWSLDPLTDPLGARMIADFLAVQSRQFDWFDRVYEEISKESPWVATWDFSNALKEHMKHGDHTATSLLQTCILTHPWVVPHLANTCGLNIDEDAWRVYELTVRPAFNHVGALREAIAKLYAARSGPLWKPSKVCLWLENTMGVCLSLKLSDSPESPKLADYRPSIVESLPIFRHTLLSDLQGVNVAIPSAVCSGPVRLYDPLPAEDIIEDSRSLQILSKCLML